MIATCCGTMLRGNASVPLAKSAAVAGSFGGVAEAEHVQRGRLDLVGRAGQDEVDVVDAGEEPQRVADLVGGDALEVELAAGDAVGVVEVEREVGAEGDGGVARRADDAVERRGVEAQRLEVGLAREDVAVEAEAGGQRDVVVGGRRERRDDRVVDFAGGVRDHRVADRVVRRGEQSLPVEPRMPGPERGEVGVDADGDRVGDQRLPPLGRAVERGQRGGVAGEGRRRG